MTTRRTRLGAARKRGLTVVVRCSRSCIGTVNATIDKATARRLKLGRKTATIASGKFTLAAKGQKVVKLKLTKRAKRALRSAPRLLGKRALKLRFTAKVSDPKRAQRLTLNRKASLKR